MKYNKKRLPKYVYGTDNLEKYKFTPNINDVDPNSLDGLESSVRDMSRIANDLDLGDAKQSLDMSKYKSTNKPDLAGIGGMAATAVGGFWDNATQETSKDALGRTHQTQSNFNAIGSGALKGAGMGASFGPWGAAAGALIGGVYGGITNASNTAKVNATKREAVGVVTDLNNTNAVNKLNSMKAQGYSSQGNGYSSIYRKGGYITKLAKGGNIYKEARQSLSKEDLVKLDEEYTNALSEGKQQYKSKITGLDYKVMPKADRVYAANLPIENTTKTIEKAPNQVKRYNAYTEEISSKSLNSIPQENTSLVPDNILEPVIRKQPDNAVPVNVETPQELESKKANTLPIEGKFNIPNEVKGFKEKVKQPYIYDKGETIPIFKQVAIMGPNKDGSNSLNKINQNDSSADNVLNKFERGPDGRLVRSCKTGKCAEYANTRLVEIFNNSFIDNISEKQRNALLTKVGSFGNAWENQDNIVKAGGKALMNLYKGKVNTNIDKELKDGDVVGLDYADSKGNPFDLDANGKPKMSTRHQGIVRVDASGKKYIEHNIHGNMRGSISDPFAGVYLDPINVAGAGRLTIAKPDDNYGQWTIISVSRPNYAAAKPKVQVGSKQVKDGEFTTINTRKPNLNSVAMVAPDKINKYAFGGYIKKYAEGSELPKPSPFPAKTKIKYKKPNTNVVRLNSDNTSSYTDVPKNANNPAPDPLSNIIYQTVADQRSLPRAYNIGSEAIRGYNTVGAKAINAGLELVKSKTPIMGDVLANIAQEFVSAVDGSIEDKDKYKSRLDSKIRKFSEGGMIQPEYEVEGNEVVQGTDTQLEGQQDLASDMTKAVGPTHADGGVKGQGGERVFSDRLYASPLIHSYLSANKVKVSKNPTYAEVAEALGKKKGKYEEKLKSHNPLTHNTGKAMTGRINDLIEATFQEQEMFKQQEEMKNPKYAKGGKLPKYPIGGPKPYTGVTQYGIDPNEFNTFLSKTGRLNGSNRTNATVDEFNDWKKPPLTDSDIANSLDGLDPKEIYMNKLANPDITKDVNALTEKALAGMSSPSKTTTNATTTTGSPFSKPSSTGTFLKNNLNNLSENLDYGQAVNLGVYLNNVKNANKQKTGITRQVAAPTYMRNVNILPYSQYNINKQARTAGIAVDRASGNVQDTFGRKQAIAANAMDATSQAAVQQAQADMQVNNQNTAINNDYRNRLVVAANEDAIDKLQGENAILTNKQGASNAFLQGVMGNIASNRSYRVDKEKNAIARSYAGTRGTDVRSTEKLRSMVGKDGFTSTMFEEITGMKYKKGGYIKSKMKGYC
jgi:hypothetical protein